MRVIQSIECLPQVMYRGKTAKIIGTRHGVRRDSGEAAGRYFDLLIGDHIYRAVHESQTKPCEEEPEAMHEVVIANAYGSVQRIQLAVNNA